MGLQRVRHDWTTFTPLHLIHKMKRGYQATPVTSVKRRTVHLRFYWAYKLPGCLFFFFFWTFYFVLGYSQLTMLWQFQVNSKGTRPCVHMYPFSPRLLPSRLPCNICSTGDKNPISRSGPIPSFQADMDLGGETLFTLLQGVGWILCMIYIPDTLFSASDLQSNEKTSWLLKWKGVGWFCVSWNR